LNAVAVLVCPDLHSIATSAIQKLKRGNHVNTPHEHVQLWPSIFSGIEVISNRVTPLHRDAKSAPPVYDFLVSAGTHTNAWLDVPDVKARLLYKPCTVIAVCGKVLRHGVESWEGGERLCFAHFIRDAVHERLQIPRPEWVTMGAYTDSIDEGFTYRQGLSVD
jgi:hypothetical protein